MDDMRDLVSREERIEITTNLHSILPDHAKILLRRLLLTLNEKDAEMRLVREGIMGAIERTHANGMAVGQMAERATVVSWLRDNRNNGTGKYDTWGDDYAMAANCIEKGEHYV